MQDFNKDLDALCRDWNVWSRLSCDDAAREVMIKRSDEDEATITVFVPATYPRGAMRLECVFGQVYTCSDKRVADALDEALAKWCDLEDESEEGMGRERSSHVFDAAMQGGGSTGAAVQVEPKRFDQAKVALDKEMRELNAASSLPRGGYYYDAIRKQYIVRIAIELTSRMTRFRANALGLDLKKLLVVELIFPYDYLLGSDMPRVVATVQVDAKELNAPPKEAPGSVGALKWYFANRMGNALRKNHIVRERKSLKIEEDGSYVEGLSDWKFDGPWEDFALNGNTNFLIGLYNVFEHRLEQCTSVCLICDKPLGVESMKTAICDGDLCRHSLENYGIGTDVLSEITKSSMVCELLIYLSYAAAKMGSQRDTFNPMCPVILDQERLPKDYAGALHFYSGLPGSGSKNFPLLVSTLEKIPRLSEMIATANGKLENLRNALNAKDPLVYPLLQWILASNRAHLEPIDAAHLIPGMGKYQFHLVSSTPEKERMFREKREAAKVKTGKGSFLAWHGSAPNNWHCILRMGLKNYSNSKYMSAGAAYGPGIYTAKSTAISQSYLGATVGALKTAEQIPHKAGLILIALCEVVNDANGFKDHSNDIITIQDETLCNTRFLFVFPDSFTGNASLRGDDVKLPELEK